VPLWKELKQWQVCSLSLCGLFLVAFSIFLLNFSDAFFVADSGNSWTGVSTSLQSRFLYKTDHQIAKKCDFFGLWREKERIAASVS
jgi:hypothetical protein